MQEFANTKRTFANARHGVGDGDGLQGFANTKRQVANARHGVGDGDGMQGFTVMVFVTHCVSAIFDYNGRKVMA